ncbi:MAG TPA: cytochrome c3 family protein, partial [Thermodesulfovibrionales bacterium]|nr:cytochrome c3 family protein [Thermodesulfovibrionales bacterium]
DKGYSIDVNIDEERFSKSVHGGMECTSCHKTFKNNPHEAPKGSVSREISELASLIAPKAKKDPVAYAACTECHGDIYAQVSESVHGKNVVVKKEHEGALCLDCHGSPHYIMPGKSRMSTVNRVNIVETCGGCHEKEDIAKKYGFGTHIIEKYQESFHGKKYKLGHPDVPTCVDCHGAHGIKKWDDLASPMSWTNRITTCGKCHPGANKKFVASITHKPIGKDNPIPYYAEKGLIVLTVGTIAFVVFHVFLEAFADIRDRVFRKDKEVSHYDD